MKTYILIATFLLTSVCFGQKIKVNGKWKKTLKISDISDAGGDYNTFYESKSNQTKITVTKNPNYQYLYIDVHKEDEEWHPDLDLQIKRTNSKNNIFYGRGYQSITNYSSPFFEMYGNSKNIPIQYKITGLSVLLPATSYSTKIVFTIWDY